MPVIAFMTARMTVSATLTDELGDSAIAFNEPWGAFFRKLFGCAPTEREPGNCQPAAREIDYTLFRKSREAAKKLFDI